MDLLKIAESLDRLMTIDISARGAIGVLYEAARSRQGEPLTMAAVRLLQQSIKPGDYALIATGWADQPHTVPENGESDGPPGAVALARSLRQVLKAAPVIVTDPYLVAGVKQIARAAGFHCVPPEKVICSVENNSIPTIAVVPFPLGHHEGKKAADSLIAALNPAVCIAVERGGMNEFDRIHSMSGFDTGEFQAKLDYLFRTASKNNIPTLAIGDGGNEIGMANIAADIRHKIVNGTSCQCPCGAGITPCTPVDILLTATISNWGAYAVCALLAAASGLVDTMNDAGKEKRVLRMTAEAGFHDPLYGLVAPSVDGCQEPVHLSVVTLMREIVLQGLKRSAGKGKV